MITLNNTQKKIISRNKRGQNKTMITLENIKIKR